MSKSIPPPLASLAMGVDPQSTSADLPHTSATQGADESSRPRVAAWRPCPLCGAMGTVPCFTGAPPYSVVACDACGLARTEPVPHDDELRTLYVGDYRTPSGRRFGPVIEAGRRMFARALAARVARRLGRGGRALDIGCGDGMVLVALAAHGYEGVGTELFAPATPFPPGRIQVHCRRVEELALPAASFRVVILRHVLEHVRDPLAVLREARRLVEPGGAVVVMVPNFASVQARIAQGAWFHLDLPRHLVHFTPTTLTAALERTGFAVERTGHFSLEQNPFGWLQSVFSMAGGRWGALYGRLRSAATPGGAARDLAVVATAAVLAPLCVAAASAESLARRGATIEVWARPLLPEGQRVDTLHPRR